MKKIIAGKFINDVWHPQKESEIDEHDQNLLNSCQHIFNIEKQLRCDLTDKQKIDLMLSEGVEKTKSTIEEIEKIKKHLLDDMDLALESHAKLIQEYDNSRG